MTIYSKNEIRNKSNENLFLLIINLSLSDISCTVENKIRAFINCTTRIFLNARLSLAIYYTKSVVCRSYNLIGSKTKVTFTNQMHTLREERSGSQLHERRLEEGVETLLDRKLPPEGTRATDVRALNTFQVESSIFFTCLLAGEKLFFVFSRFVFAFIRGRNGSEKSRRRYPRLVFIIR